MWPFKRKGPTGPTSPEEKFQRLAECGFKLRPEFSASKLIESWGREVLAGSDFKGVLVCLGSEGDAPPYTPRCDNLWHFDTECIEDHGSYKRIAQRMSDMAGESLPLTDIEDYVDIDEGKAWLRFRCKGQAVQIDCKVEDDWVDTDVFGHFIQLLAKCDPNKLFIYYDLGGQDCIIGCATRSQYAQLQRVIPEIRPLSQ